MYIHVYIYTFWIFVRFQLISCFVMISWIVPSNIWYHVHYKLCQSGISSNLAQEYPKANTYSALLSMRQRVRYFGIDRVPCVHMATSIHTWPLVLLKLSLIPIPHYTVLVPKVASWFWHMETIDMINTKMRPNWVSRNVNNVKGSDVGCLCAYLTTHVCL